MSKTQTVSLLKKDMSFVERLDALGGGDMLVKIKLSILCNEAVKIRDDKNASYEVLTILDELGVYKEDILKLLFYVAGGDMHKVLTLIWTYQISTHKKNSEQQIPKYVTSEFIRNAAFQKEKFPFKKAKRFLERESDIRFPDKLLILPS